MTAATELLWKSATGPITHQGTAGVMGIVNLTPDSFYEKSRVQGTEAAVERCLAMLADGADILDLGAESSRPGAAPVTPETEQERLLPVIDALMALETPPVISVDTYHAATARAVLEHGCAVINDISGFSFDPALLEVVAEYRPAYILMHCQGTPDTMQDNPRYGDVVSDVTAFFEAGMERLVRAGLPEENILLDPGIGFGKRAGHNLALMNHPEAWAHLGRPSLMALSMKSVFGDVLGLPTAERGEATRIATALSFQRGYLWHRVHDALAARRALTLTSAILNA